MTEALNRAVLYLFITMTAALIAVQLPGVFQ